MVSLSKRRKEARLQSYDGRILTARKYNATIFGMILYGLVANFLICLFCSEFCCVLPGLSGLCDCWMYNVCGIYESCSRICRI